MKDKKETKIFALGGIGEVGKNMYCIEHDDELLIIDSGVMFPEDNLMGIDYVIQDYTYLVENKDKIAGVIITHGHEDHIGGLPFLLNTVTIPVIWAPKQARALIKRKLEDRKVRYSNLKEYSEDIVVRFKHFSIEFFRTNHSIPDSHGLAITTPNGVIVETGDFKFDFAPVGPVANLHKMAEIGKRGVDLLLSESTNSLTEGFSKSESIVDEALSDIFAQETENRIIVATFASNIYRLKHITDTCHENGRKIAVLGRSMDNAVDISRELGYIDKKDIFIDISKAVKMPPSKVAILCTGSQGETLAALTRIANGSHRQVKIQSEDVVVFSSSPIPGNETGVNRTINQLYLKGVKVYNNSINSGVHASGHGYAGELQLMQRLMMAKYFMPIHGEYMMLKKHSDLAVECGIPRKNIFICKNGDVLTLKNGVVKRGTPVTASDVYVDGNRIGDIGNAVIKDRKIMANDGIVVILCNVDGKTRKLLGNPNITTRGFVLISESETMLRRISDISKKTMISELKKDVPYKVAKTELINKLNLFIQKETGRKPIIMPVIMEI